MDIVNAKDSCYSTLAGKSGPSGRIVIEMTKDIVNVVNYKN